MSDKKDKQKDEPKKEAHSGYVMSPATRLLHETLLRLAKGATGAWEVWLSKH